MPWYGVPQPTAFWTQREATHQCESEMHFGPDTLIDANADHAVSTPYCTPTRVVGWAHYFIHYFYRDSTPAVPTRKGSSNWPTRSC